MLLEHIDVLKKTLLILWIVLAQHPQQLVTIYAVHVPQRHKILLQFLTLIIQLLHEGNNLLFILLLPVFGLLFLHGLPINEVEILFIRK